jgi:uncharacterized protein YxjI/DNA-binding transcriptional regulator GbsR (MarR family)
VPEQAEMFDYIERFAALLMAAGFPPMPARVFVALTVADARMSASELADQLRVSPAAVSGGVRYLMQLGMVDRERVPGSRRDYYRMTGTVWQDMMRIRNRVMHRWVELLREGIGMLKPDSPAAGKMTEQAAFIEFASDQVADIIARWEEYRVKGGEAGKLPGMRYLVREKLFSIRDDFWITDERGGRPFYVSGKLLSLHGTLVLHDAHGRKLASVKHKLVTFTDKMEIEHDGKVAATVHKAVFSPLHHKAFIDIHDGPRIEATGNILDKDFEIKDGHRVVARISRKWFRIRDTYGVDVAPGENDALIICIAVCLDRIHEEESSHRLRYRRIQVREGERAA